MRRAKIAIFGSVNQASSTDVLARILELKGAKVSIYLPTTKKYSSDSCSVNTSLNESVEGADCIVILSGYERFNQGSLKKLKPLMKTNPVIVDLVGKFDQQEVKIEGFIYCGLGRGTG